VLPGTGAQVGNDKFILADSYKLPTKASFTV